MRSGDDTLAQDFTQDTFVRAFARIGGFRSESSPAPRAWRLPPSLAILPITIADSVVVSPRLLEIAKDDSHAKAVRKQAVFWVSQAAGDKTTAGLVEIVGDKAADSDVRLQAVFALSQRPKDEVVPAL